MMHKQLYGFGLGQPQSTASGGFEAFHTEIFIYATECRLSIITTCRTKKITCL